MSLSVYSVISIALLLAACASSQSAVPASVSAGQIAESSSSLAYFSAGALSSGVSGDEFVSPLSEAQRRVTKKPFGIHVSPSSSPVSPERFSGYHTGEDFETFPEEQDADVPVAAICSGTVRFTGWVKGYGGVLIQQCLYQNQPVTVLYGHLNTDSLPLRSGSGLMAGGHIGMLGKGYSTQTDGERKHLHLAVHKGAAINYRGYVPTAAALKGWINPFPSFASSDLPHM
ncbi:MAG: hypothetical protein JWM56_296 [Candidatus Peribacteria bacterium]|nr:hypothetical protein [Candidatus Peribacteria bacterium]